MPWHFLLVMTAKHAPPGEYEVCPRPACLSPIQMHNYTFFDNAATNQDYKTYLVMECSHATI